MYFALCVDCVCKRIFIFVFKNMFLFFVVIGFTRQKKKKNKIDRSTDHQIQVLRYFSLAIQINGPQLYWTIVAFNIHSTCEIPISYLLAIFYFASLQANQSYLYSRKMLSFGTKCWIVWKATEATHKIRQISLYQHKRQFVQNLNVFRMINGARVQLYSFVWLDKAHLNFA